MKKLRILLMMTMMLISCTPESEEIIPKETAPQYTIDKTS